MLSPLYGNARFNVRNNLLRYSIIGLRETVFINGGHAMRTWKSCIITASSILFIFIPLWGTTLIEMSLEEMVGESDEIIIAETTSMNSYTRLNGTRIYTDIHFKVRQKIKGKVGENEELKLTIYGGTVNGITTYVVGGPQFVTEQTYLLFFKATVVPPFKTKYSVVGLSQGKFEIMKDPSTNQQVITRRDFPGSLKIDRGGQNTLQLNTQESRLQNLLELIATYL